MRIWDLFAVLLLPLLPLGKWCYFLHRPPFPLVHMPYIYIFILGSCLEISRPPLNVWGRASCVTICECRFAVHAMFYSSFFCTIPLLLYSWQTADTQEKTFSDPRPTIRISVPSPFHLLLLFGKTKREEVERLGGGEKAAESCSYSPKACCGPWFSESNAYIRTWISRRTNIISLL